MEYTATNTTRFKLPARIRNKRSTAAEFEARVALADRIADLPGIETIERSDESMSCRVDIYLRHDGKDQGPNSGPVRFLCGIDRESVTVNGLDRWGRYQVLSCGWGKLVDDLVYVHLPRDLEELEAVWIVVQRAYSRLYDSTAPKPGSSIVSTWDWPKFSRTSLQ